MRKTTARVLATLTAPESGVLRMRFGLRVNMGRAREKVGQRFSVTRERIRRGEAYVPRKLKQPAVRRRGWLVEPPTHLYARRGRHPYGIVARAKEGPYI